jgi:hypothetical protein
MIRNVAAGFRIRSCAGDKSRPFTQSVKGLELDVDKQ